MRIRNTILTAYGILLRAGSGTPRGNIPAAIPAATTINGNIGSSGNVYPVAPVPLDTHLSKRLGSLQRVECLVIMFCAPI